MSLSQRKAAPIRHICHCGKSFARKEHLTRHKATHDSLIHICNICQRRFSRGELLRRHSVLHDVNRTRVPISCNACRANKTKCSGENPCSLCTHRGILCVYRNDANRTATGSKDDLFEPSLVPASDDRHDQPPSETSTSLDRSMENSFLSKRPPLGQEWLEDLLIIPSKPTVPNDFQPTSTGIGAVYELLLAEKPTLEGAIEDSPELQDWLDNSFKVYMTRFHLHWPVLNVPSFVGATSPVPLTASVCLIGTWMQSNVTQDERRYALRIHDLLLTRFLNLLIDPRFIPQGQAWPVEILEAVLLVLVFVLYRPGQGTWSRSMLLRGIFIGLLRNEKMFTAEVLVEHLRTHFTGIYAPYSICMREKFRRLLALTYQFDVYFALASNSPPMLHRQELGPDLTMSFALWNAHGLDIFARRLQEEPTGRSGFQISTMTERPDSFTSSQLLVEDIILGLAGTLQSIWAFSQPSTSHSDEHHVLSHQTSSPDRLIDKWKHELDKIRCFVDARDITNQNWRYFLLVYRGEDDSTEGVLSRVTAMIFEGLTLYYFLKLSLSAGVGSPDFTDLSKYPITLRSGSTQMTRCGRETLACALQLLGMVESINTPQNPVNALCYYALDTGKKLVRKLLESYDQCLCSTSSTQAPKELDVEEWKTTGGLLVIDGNQVCACTSEFWINKFEEAMKTQRTMTPVVSNSFAS